MANHGAKYLTRDRLPGLRLRDLGGLLPVDIYITLIPIATLVRNSLAHIAAAILSLSLQDIYITVAGVIGMAEGAQRALPSDFMGNTPPNLGFTIAVPGQERE